MNPTVTIFMPVSRPEYLEAIFSRLELLDCVRENTNLLVMVDGDAKLFIQARNYVEQSKFSQRLCVQYKDKRALRRYDILGRRLRIAKIHNESKQYIKDCDYVFGIEDDTIIPTYSLKRLLKRYFEYPHAGFITGVQIARWGIPHVGAWKVDDVYEPKKVESLAYKNDGFDDVDAAGFYCYLTKRRNYVNHDYKVFGQNTLGPDTNFGIEMRQEGHLNYIDWSIATIHKCDQYGDLAPKDVEQHRIAVFEKGDKRWFESNHL